MTVSALFIDPKGPYTILLGDDRCWYESRDARTFVGDGPVVCHSPCHLWINLACVNYKRYGKQIPAWKPGGSDGGCFEAALKAVRRCGGVLEHPAGSHAWAHYGLAKPATQTMPDFSGGMKSSQGFGWTPISTYVREYVCEVWQSAPKYGHKARKRTWLLYCGKRPPFELDWSRKPGTHQCGWFDRARPTLSKVEASRTPVRFAQELIQLAEWSKG